MKTEISSPIGRTFEIVDIKRTAGNTEGDNERIGLRVYVSYLSVGSPSILPLSDDSGESIFTSTVTSFTFDHVLTYLDITTSNTKYILREVR